jgi:hypothetical protein
VTWSGVRHTYISQDCPKQSRAFERMP